MRTEQMKLAQKKYYQDHKEELKARRAAKKTTTSAVTKRKKKTITKVLDVKCGRVTVKLSEAQRKSIQRISYHTKMSHKKVIDNLLTFGIQVFKSSQLKIAAMEKAKAEEQERLEDSF